MDTEMKKSGDDFEEMLEYVTNFCTDKLLEYQSASNWKSQNDSISWYLPHTKAIAMLSLKPSASVAGQYRVSLGVTPEGSDQTASCFLEKGTREEMLEYLKKPETRLEIMSTTKKLWKVE